MQAILYGVLAGYLIVSFLVLIVLYFLYTGEFQEMANVFDKDIERQLDKLRMSGMNETYIILSLFVIGFCWPVMLALSKKLNK